MKLFTISDLHLSFGTDKPMNIFKGWENYTRIETASLLWECDRNWWNRHYELDWDYERLLEQAYGKLTHGGSLSPDELVAVVSSGNDRQLKNVKGIGAKTAQRIVIDLKDKLKKIDIQTEIFSVPNNTIRTEALSALTILGFNKAAIEKALDKILKQNPDATVEALIKEALKIL